MKESGSISPAGVTPDPRAARILVVEDDELVARELVLRIEAMGYGVVNVAVTGAEAVEVAERERPDLVLMDIVLPGEIDGIEAARIILDEQHLPLLYLTAYADEALFARARITGPHAYLLKPYNDRELNLAIELALQRHQRDSWLREQAVRRDQRVDELSALVTAVVEGSTDCIFAKDREGRYVLANHAMEMLLERTRAEILGCRDEDLFPADTVARVRVNDLRVMSMESVETFEETVSGAAGDTVFMSTKGCLRIAGEVAGVFGIARDISEQKRAELRERRLSNFYNAIAHTNQAIAHAGTEVELFQRACEIVVRYGEVGSAWIGFTDSEGWVSVVAQCGLDDDYVAKLRVSADPDKVEGRCAVGNALRDGEPMVLNDLGVESGSPEPDWQVRARAVGINAIAAFPIRRGGHVVGALSLGAAQPGFFDADLSGLLQELTADISFALDKLDVEAQRLHAEAELRAALSRLHVLSKCLIEVQESERRSVARDLHDDIGQSLTTIKIILGGLRITHEGAYGDEIREAAEIAGRALERVRSLSIALRPPQLDDLGLASALRAHLDETARHAGLDLRFVADPLPAEVPESIAIACFRIAQEAMTNVVRHANASKVSVELRCSGGRLALTLRDDGCGYDVASATESAARGKSLGLLSMQERAALAGGVLELSSTADGSEVNAIFPLGASSGVAP